MSRSRSAHAAGGGVSPTSSAASRERLVRGAASAGGGFAGLRPLAKGRADRLDPGVGLATKIHQQLAELLEIATHVGLFGVRERRHRWREGFTAEPVVADLLVEGDRLPRRADTDLVAKRIDAVRVLPDRRRPIAIEVAQAHEPPVRALVRSIDAKDRSPYAIPASKLPSDPHRTMSLSSKPR